MEVAKAASSEEDYEDDFERDEYEDDFELDVESPTGAARKIVESKLSKEDTSCSFDIGKVNFCPASPSVGASICADGGSVLDGGVSVLQGSREAPQPPCEVAEKANPSQGEGDYSAWMADNSLNPNELSGSLSSSSHLSAMPLMPFPPQSAGLMAPVTVAPNPQRLPLTLSQQQQPQHQASLPLTPPGPQDTSDSENSSRSAHVLDLAKKTPVESVDSDRARGNSSSASGSGPRTALSAGGLSEAVLLPYHTQLIVPGRWKLGRRIGAGTFGTVHQGLNEDTGMAIAVKVLKRQSGADEENRSRVGEGAPLEADSDMRELQNEISVMRGLDHPNIVRYLGCQAEPGCLYIFQEWVPCGSVAEMIKNYGPLGEQVCARYLSQMLHGLAYLHDRRVVHRDIKGGNVLVNEFGVAKLADFGCSKRMGSDGTLGEQSNSALKGTPYFMAPEVIKNDRAGRASDVWSLGGVCFQMLTGEPPWKCLGIKTPMVLFYQVVNAEPGHPPLDRHGDLVTPTLKAVMLRCFMKDPQLRPTARELLGDQSLLSCLDARDAAAARLEFAKRVSPQNPAAVAPDPTPVVAREIHAPPASTATATTAPVVSVASPFVPPTASGASTSSTGQTAGHEPPPTTSSRSRDNQPPFRSQSPASSRPSATPEESSSPPPPPHSLASQPQPAHGALNMTGSYSPPPPHLPDMPVATPIARAESTETVCEDEALMVSRDDGFASAGAPRSSPPPADVASSPETGRGGEDEDEQQRQRSRQQQQAAKLKHARHLLDFRGELEAPQDSPPGQQLGPGVPSSIPRPSSRRPSLPPSFGGGGGGGAGGGGGGGTRSHRLPRTKPPSYTPAVRRSTNAERRWGVNGYRSASAPSAAGASAAAGRGQAYPGSAGGGSGAMHTLEGIGDSAPAGSSGPAVSGQNSHRPITAPESGESLPAVAADENSTTKPGLSKPPPCAMPKSGGPGTPGLVREERPLSSLSRFKARFQDSDPARRSTVSHPHHSSHAPASSSLSSQDGYN